MKRNLRTLLLTRVYNGRSTTIFCVTSVTSVTRRLLDTTTTRCDTSEGLASIPQKQKQKVTRRESFCGILANLSEVSQRYTCHSSILRYKERMVLDRKVHSSSVNTCLCFVYEGWRQGFVKLQGVHLKANNLPHLMYVFFLFFVPIKPIRCIKHVKFLQRN